MGLLLVSVTARDVEGRGNSRVSVSAGLRVSRPFCRHLAVAAGGLQDSL